MFTIHIPLWKDSLDVGPIVCRRGLNSIAAGARLRGAFQLLGTWGVYDDQGTPNGPQMVGFPCKKDPNKVPQFRKPPCGCMVGCGRRRRPIQ